MALRSKVNNLAQAVAALTGSGEKIHKGLGRLATRVGAESVKRIHKRRSAKKTTTRSTAVRSGRLRRAYDSQVGRRGSGVVLRVGVIKPGTGNDVLAYAGVHENNGVTTIRPKNGKFLAIPLPAAKTAAGVARGGPRDFNNTFVVRGKRGPVIMQKQGRGAVPLFALRKKVDVKGRPALRPVVDRYATPTLKRKAPEVVADAVRF